MTLYEYAKNIYDTILQKGQINATTQAIIASTSFETLIDDHKKGLELIRSIVEFNVGRVSINLYRVSHILITWLLGIGLSEHFDLKEKGFLGNLYYPQLWLQTAIIHDYGYFCRKELSDVDLSIDKITVPYSLLTDTYSSKRLDMLSGLSALSDFQHYFTYSYDEISKYFKYAKHIHIDKKEHGSIADIKPGTEINDHGIVGGCLAFKRYCQEVERVKIDPSYAINYIQKIACYTAASHNIFKSRDAEKDVEYNDFGLTELLSSSPVRISLDNKLLLLLSLVDTIECTKRFSASAGRIDGKENLSQKEPKYFQQSTTIKNVDISFQEEKVLLDFSNIRKHINDRKDFSEDESMDFQKRLDDHICGIKDLSTWTPFSASGGESGDAVCVFLQSNSRLSEAAEGEQGTGLPCS